MKLFLSTILVIYIFAGCSSKQYFEPEDTSDFSVKSQNMSSSIAFLNKDGATLEDFRIINKNGISSYTLEEGYHFLNTSDKTTLLANKNGNLLVGKKNITFKQNVVSATKKDDLLALVLANNTLVVYDLTMDKFVMQEKLTVSFLNDTRIANPVFLDDIIIFPTLNGKLLLVNTTTKKVIQSINIDPSGKVNNVIFLAVVNDIMIASTPNKILSITDKSFNIQDYAIKDIISANNNIYISTIDGNIIKLDLQLAVLASKKFKFAQLYSLGYGTSLFALESQGYLINLDDNFEKVKIYDFSFDETANTIAIGDTLYFDDEYIKLP